MNVAAHEADAGENKADQTDHRARVFRERLDGLHQRLSATETDGSLSVGDGAAGAHEQQRTQRWPHDMGGLEKVSLGEDLRQPLGKTGGLTGHDGTAGEHWHLQRPV